ncbi:MAG: response regulator transcription factor [Bacilli bacterium]|nr:response regulator transcription factor [Bacilli bacterium]
MKKILIVEDDIEIANLEKDYLEVNNFETKIINDGLKVEEEVKNNQYNLIILDIMLPNISGLEICKTIRNITKIPIIMVTAKGEAIDKIKGLNIGADDYVVKPFDPAELVARCKSNINMYERINLNTSEIIINDLKIIPDNYKVFKNNKEIKMPNKEFELLLFLITNPNIVFSKEQLFEKIWGLEYVSDDATVTVHINRIREKIEDDSSNPKYIETVYRAGYRFNR